MSKPSARELLAEFCYHDDCPETILATRVEKVLALKVQKATITVGYVDQATAWECGYDAALWDVMQLLDGEAGPASDEGE